MERAKMVRKQLYLEVQQDQKLKWRARELGLPEAEIVRVSLDYCLPKLRELLEGQDLATTRAPAQAIMEATATAYATREEAREMSGFVRRDNTRESELLRRLVGREKEAWRDEMAFMKSRTRLVATKAEGRWGRDDLYDERISGRH